MLSPQLTAALNKLSRSLQAKVLQYAEYLAAKYSPTPQTKTAPKIYRQAGTMKGMFTMAKDFDAPLEDFKDYM